jgi:hypothetical protein
LAVWPARRAISEQVSLRDDDSVSVCVEVLAWIQRDTAET